MLRSYFLSVFILLLVLTTNAFAQNRSGTYYWNWKNKSINVLTIVENKKTKKKTIQFKLGVNQIDAPCVGEITGKAKQISTNVFEYNSNSQERDTGTNERIFCRLTFIFSGNTVTVRENDCSDFHGARCSFEGDYKRTNRSKIGQWKIK